MTESEASKFSSTRIYSWCSNNDDDDEAVALLGDIHKDQLQPKPESYSAHFYWLLSSLIALVGCKFIGLLSRLVVVSVVGHLGAHELAGMSLAQMLDTCSSLSFAYGMMSALDTLCGQSWTGAKDKTLIGLHLQRGLAIYAVVLIPIGIFWVVALQLLRNGDTEEDVIYYAGMYLIFFIPGDLSWTVYDMVASYLQAQGIMRVGAFCIAMSLPVTVAVKNILVAGNPFHLGVAGAALADAAPGISALVIIIIYTCFIAGSQGWGGWTIQCLRGWGSIIRLCIPAICLSLFQLGVPQLCTLAASRFGSATYLAAHFILLRTSQTVVSSIGRGLKQATTTRVGNLIGKGSLTDIKRAITILTLIAFVLGMTLSICLVIFQSSYPFLYTNDESVAKAVTEVLPVVALQLIVIPWSNLAMGICDGLGRQRIEVAVSSVSYFVIGLPLCYYFAFSLGWSIFGLWVGLTVSELVVAVILFAHLWMLDWTEELREIKKSIAKEQATYS
ncbi:mate-domain-containing protein [Zychaea mexicana]|uniref:mate-domain-containing protein n=1 Tax=Zychaea mexicana TaxID=64656 RepID=UPI0022FEF687|nr:mate-domain-containing protein [Zychaea mexicana]KAI9494566.1 mate-domain-containing protein [Zychaea mexicana]